VKNFSAENQEKHLARVGQNSFITLVDVFLNWRFVAVSGGKLSRSFYDGRDGKADIRAIKGLI